MPRNKDDASQRYDKKTADAATTLSKSLGRKRLSASDRRKKHSESYGKIVESALKKTGPDLDFLLIGSAYLLALSEYPFGDAGYKVWLSLVTGGEEIRRKWFKEDSDTEARIAFLTALDKIEKQRIDERGGAWEWFRGENLTPFECSVVLASFAFYFKRGEYKLELTDCLSLALPGARCLKEAMRSFSEERALVSKKLIEFRKGSSSNGQNMGTFIALTKECEDRMLALLDPALVRHDPGDDLMDMFKQEMEGKSEQEEAPKEQQPEVPSRKIEDLILPDDMWWEVKEAVQAYIGARDDSQAPGRLPPVFLFSGPPGTGKTFAAEAIAGSLEMPIHTVPVTSLIQKYYGETPKAVKKAFTEAQKAKAVLFFDEADSFLWSREGSSEAHDGHLVNAFLHFIDIREVPVIFATNMKDKLDPALFRRIDVMVDFPVPDADARENIWRSVLSQFQWGAEVDLVEVRKIHITGGLMHNAARSVDRKLLTGRITAESLNKSLIEEAKKQTAKMAEVRLAHHHRIRGFETE